MAAPAPQTASRAKVGIGGHGVWCCSRLSNTSKNGKMRVHQRQEDINGYPLLCIMEFLINLID